MRLLVLMLLLLVPGAARAQCVLGADSARPADVRIFARVRASEMRFNTQPHAETDVLGCAAADTLRVLVRTNLPEPVKPGVTYRESRSL